MYCFKKKIYVISSRYWEWERIGNGICLWYFNCKVYYYLFRNFNTKFHFLPEIELYGPKWQDVYYIII